MEVTDEVLSPLQMWGSTSSSYLRRTTSDNNDLLSTAAISIHFEDHDRALTYLDTDDATFEQIDETVPDLGLTIGFSVLAAVFFLVMLVTIRLSSSCHAFYEWNALRLLLPAVAAFLCMATATLAVQASGTAVPGPWAITVFMVSSTVAPGIFLFSFVITFLAYRTRSMPFCFVHRGPSRQVTTEPWRDDDEEVLQPLVRPAVLVVAIRLFALGLLILNLIVNFDVVWTEDNFAARTGWATVVSDPENPSLDHIILALVPMALVSLLCLYFSFLLWRYGCELSLVIYRSGIVNPWLTPVFGSIAMIIGQLFGPDLYLITSNSGILLYMLSMVRILYEARKDLEVSGDLGHFLDALGNDNVTRTQKGLEKDAHGDEDTLSSGQHQQWMLNESNNEVSLVSDIESQSRPIRILPKTESYHSQNSGSSSMRQHPVSKKSNFKTGTLKPTEEFPGEEQTIESDRLQQNFPRTTVGNGDEDPSDTANLDADVAVTRVQGANGKPEKLRRGQRPKGRFVVY